MMAHLFVLFVCLSVVVCIDFDWTDRTDWTDWDFLLSLRISNATDNNADLDFTGFADPFSF